MIQQHALLHMTIVVQEPGVQAHFQKVLICQKSGQIWQRSFDIFDNTHIFVTKCTNKNVLCHRKHSLYMYKINKLFLVSLCFSVREWMSD